MESFEIRKLNLDYSIYTNIASLVAFRGKTITGGGFDGKESTYPLSEIEFDKKNKSNHYTILLVDDITFIIIPVGSEFYKKNKLAVLLGKVKSERTIVVKPVKCKVKGITSDKVEVIDGDIYLIIDWVAASAAKGRSMKVVKPDEWANGVLHNNFYVDIDELPAIHSSACEVVWSGARVGDVIELTSPSLSSNGYTSTPHRVV
jgi:DNA-directed RNA polymerase subunit H (RpoH/RPB5)